MLYIIIVICLTGASLYLAFRLHTLYRAMEKAGKDLEEISEDLAENRVVKAAVPDKKLEKLLRAVNENLAAIRRERYVYMKNERKLKEQIENISHDLRTPLTAVLGYLKMIDTKELKEEDREFLEIAIKKSYSLQELTAQFYELSRVTSSDFQLKLETVDMVRVLKEACLEHYSLLEKAGLSVSLPPFEGSVLTTGNTDALRRVFSNLIQNSVRYAKSEVRIGIREEREEKKLVLSFSNDIFPEQEIREPDRLFERFYVQEQARSQSGTGLGLTISRTLTEHMGGNIRALYFSEGEKRFLSVIMEFPL